MEFSISPLTKEYRSVGDQATVNCHFAAQTQTWKAA